MARYISLASGAVILALATLAASAEEAKKPIKIGINVSLTGSFADSIKPTMLADQVWEKEINGRGGLLGRPVELTFIDNKSSPENAVAIYERLKQGGHDFIFENAGSFIVQRESTLAEQNQMLFLVPNGFAGALYNRGYKYIFYTGAALSEDLNIGLVHLLESLPADKRPSTIGYVTVENIAFTSLTKALQEMVKPLKLQTSLDVTYPPNISDTTPLVINLKQKDPDVVYQTGLTSDTISFARSVAQQGLKPKMLVIGMTTGALPSFVPSVGPVSDGMIYVSAWEPPVKTKHNQEFIKRYQEMHHVMPIYNAAQAYARWQIFEQAVNETKSLDQKTLRDFIASHSFDTVVGTIKYNEKGYSVPTDTIVTQFQGGERVIVWPSAQANGKLRYPLN
jgi:branched-chain amino acid transport system substrate-binding protein